MTEKRNYRIIFRDEVGPHGPAGAFAGSLDDALDYIEEEVEFLRAYDKHGVFEIYVDGEKIKEVKI